MTTTTRLNASFGQNRSAASTYLSWRWSRSLPTQMQMQQQQMMRGMPQQQMMRGMPPQQQMRGMPQQRGMPAQQHMKQMQYGGAPQQMQQQQQQQRRGGAFGTSQSDGFLARLERAENDERPTTHGGSTPITLDNWAQRSKQIAKLAIANEARELEAKERLAQSKQRQDFQDQQGIAARHQRNAMGQGAAIDQQMQQMMMQDSRAAGGRPVPHTDKFYNGPGGAPQAGMAGGQRQHLRSNIMFG